MALDGGCISGSVFFISRCTCYELLSLFCLSERKGLQLLVCVFIVAFRVSKPVTVSLFKSYFVFYCTLLITFICMNSMHKISL